MKKSLLIPVAILTVGIVVFASGILFPDTVSLPRFPSGPGTIGGVLTSFFDSSAGSAHNTNKLWGITASGYLHNKDCSTDPVNSVWKWVDANGQWICGNIAWLLAIGRFTELYGTVNVWRDGTPWYVPAILGQDLYPGDLIESDATGTGTIQFAADSSLIRFWQSTDLELRYGDLGGLTVAEVILNDGRLWGRILSSTGVNLWGGGMVTGVRGTSVDIIKDKITAIYTITVTDSVNTASKIQSTIPWSPLILRDINGVSIANTLFGGGTQFIYASGSSAIQKLTANKNTFYGNPWFVKNTLSDIVYMSNLLETPGISAGVSGRLNAELDATIASTNTGTLLALLAGSAIGSDILSGALLLDEENEVDGTENSADINKKKAKRMKCKREGKTYFPELSGCDGSWDTLAITDFAWWSATLYGKKAKWDYTVVAGSNFDGGSLGKITDSGNYIEYTNINLASLSWKKITLTLDSPIPCNSGSDKCYIFDGGTWNRFFISKNKTCAWGADLDNWFCKVGKSTPLSRYTWSLVLNIEISWTPTSFIIGNTSVWGYNYPIGTTINSISIK